MKNKKMKYSLVLVFVVILIVALTNRSISSQIISFVQYNGNKYLEIENIVYNEENNIKDRLIGEYLGTTNQWVPEHDVFGMSEAIYKNYDSTMIGELYTVKGYKQDFRICILDNSNSTITIFENINGIREGMKGKDFYEDMLHLKGNVKNIEYQLHSDWNEGKENYKQLINITDNDISKFIHSLYNSTFIALTSDFAVHPAQIHIYLKMGDGTTVPLQIFINGYVKCRAGVTKINEKVAQKIFDATEIKGQFVKNDVDESKYSVITYFTILNKIYSSLIIFLLIIIGITFIFIIRIINKRYKSKK